MHVLAVVGEVRDRCCGRGVRTSAHFTAEATRSLGDRFADAFGSLSVYDHFTAFGEGVVRFGDVLYFAGGIAFTLYLCAFLLGRRHW